MSKKYKWLFSIEQSKKTVAREGTVRLLTTLAALIAAAAVVVLFATRASEGSFFAGVLIAIIVLALNSLFENRFNRIVNDLISKETEADENALLRSKCHVKYKKYTDYLKKAGKFILVFSAVFAIVLVVFAVLSLFGKRGGAFFYVTGIGTFIYSLAQIVYVLVSLVKEREFFSECRAEILLLKK